MSIFFSLNDHDNQEDSRLRNFYFDRIQSVSYLCPLLEIRYLEKPHSKGPKEHFLRFSQPLHKHAISEAGD